MQEARAKTERQLQGDLMRRPFALSPPFLVCYSGALFLGLLFLIGSSGTPAFAGRKVQRESLTARGARRTYYLSVPDGASRETPAPLLLLFNGEGRNGTSLIDQWQDLAAKNGIILVAPDSSDSAQWDPRADPPNFVREIVEAVKTKYSVDPRRVYLFGNSAGGVYALYLSLTEPDYFAAAAVHGGALTEQDDHEMPVATRKIPLAIWIGTNDRHFSLTQARATRDALQAHGFPVQLNEMPGENHNYYVHSGEVNKAAWDFLSEHELQGEPRYQRHSQ
jgi:poly(3-hydroxybutyrate) depolymerase